MQDFFIAFDSGLVTAAILAFSSAKVFVSLVGATPPGKAADAFNALYAKVYHHQPLASANYAYDGTIVFALRSSRPGAQIPKGSWARFRWSPIQAARWRPRTRPGLPTSGPARGSSTTGPAARWSSTSITTCPGPFDVVQAMPNGKLRALMTIPADAIQKAAQ